MDEILAFTDTRKSRWGIRRASDYVNGFAGCLTGGACPASLLGVGGEQWSKCLKESQSRPVYSNDKMLIKSFADPADDAPEGSILVFDNILTSTRKDRDGDILDSSGAVLDLKMPLLWQHLSIQPIGKLVAELSRTRSYIKTRFAIADTELGRDAAALVKFGALRISHGFQPTKFEPIYNEKDQQTGWKMLNFEVFEGSVVSIPSNVDADILATYEKTKSFAQELDGIRTAFGRELLKSPAVKTWAKTIYDSRRKQVAVDIDLSTKEDGFKPPKGVQSAAKQGLEWRREYRRGGTQVGVARARDLSNGKSISLSTIKRMKSYFARHEVDKQAEGFSEGEDGFPSAGRIAWQLWGGDAGQTWANKIADQQDGEKGVDMPAAKTCQCQAGNKSANKAFAGDATKMYGEYHLAGSFEHVQSSLSKSLKRYLMSVDKSVGEYTWCFVMATFADHAIVCIETRGDYACHKLAYSMEGDGPAWSGDPSPVDVKVTAEVVESAKAMGVAGSKAFMKSIAALHSKEKGSCKCPECGYEGEMSKFMDYESDGSDSDGEKSIDRLEAKFAAALLRDEARMKRFRDGLNSVLEAREVDAGEWSAGEVLHDLMAVLA